MLRHDIIHNTRDDLHTPSICLWDIALQLPRIFLFYRRFLLWVFFFCSLISLLKNICLSQSALPQSGQSGPPVALSPAHTPVSSSIYVLHAHTHTLQYCTFPQASWSSVCSQTELLVLFISLFIDPAPSQFLSNAVSALFQVLPASSSSFWLLKWEFCGLCSVRFSTNLPQLGPASTNFPSRGTCSDSGRFVTFYMK